MYNWITIQSFTYPHEAHLVRTLLEAEGFPILIKDEYTAQVQPLYTAAIGGIKVQVPEEDYESAYKVLKEAGYVREPVLVTRPLLVKFDRWTAAIPGIGTMAPEIRLVVLVAILLLVVGLPLGMYLAEGSV